MLFRRIPKRVCSSSGMLLVSRCPLVSREHKPFVPGNPCPVSLTIRCFRASTPPNPSKVALTELAQPHRSLSGAATRFSRFARIEAEDALFDYLRGTRSFEAIDAEHISKNSPCFLQKLLSKVKPDQDIARTLSRFFRYNPINEFEPFFESLGLVPSEFSLLLPRDLLFLSDDRSMLENFHVLCDYGIPRTRIGKIYKEAREVFGYEVGVLGSKLRSYEELGLSKSTIIKLVSCSPSLLTGSVSCDFATVLEKLKGLGINGDWIGLYVTIGGMYSWQRVLDIMNFLEGVGYSEENMRTLFKESPTLLFEDSGKKVYVLFGCLLKLGLNVDEVSLLLSKYPQILSRKFNKNFHHAVCFMLSIGMEIKDIANIVSTHMELLGSHSLKGPKTVLKKVKGGKGRLCQIIKKDPMKLFTLASKSGSDNTNDIAAKVPNTLTDKTAFLLGLGYTENSEEMMKALKQFRGRGDQLQERFDCLVQAGLDCNVVKNMIKHAPSVLNQSKDVLEKKIDWLKNCLGYPLESIAVFPTYLCYDVERINLRFSMYAWLREQGAAKSRLSLSTLLACSEERFVKYFVIVHPEGPAMWESFQK